MTNEVNLSPVLRNAINNNTAISVFNDKFKEPPVIIETNEKIDISNNFKNDSFEKQLNQNPIDEKKGKNKLLIGLGLLLAAFLLAMPTIKNKSEALKNLKGEFDKSKTFNENLKEGFVIVANKVEDVMNTIKSKLESLKNIFTKQKIG